MDRSVAWRAALLQALLLTVTALVLASLLDRQFFEDWGWLAGPAAWAGCALVAARVLRLPAIPVLAGRALSALPSLVAVAVGQHWAGAPLGILFFGVWCGHLVGSRVPA